MKTSKVVLDTKLIQVLDTGSEYQVLIALSRGGVIEHEPFERSQQGLVAALLLAADVNAGKFFPRRVVEAHKLEIDFKTGRSTQ